MCCPFTHKVKWNSSLKDIKHNGTFRHNVEELHVYWCIQSYFSSSWFRKNKAATEIIHPFSSSSSPQIIHLLPSEYHVWSKYHRDSLLPSSHSHRTPSQSHKPWPHFSSHLQLQLWVNGHTWVWALWFTRPKRISTYDWWGTTLFCFCKKYYKYILSWMKEEKRGKNLWHMQPSVKKASNLETSDMVIGTALFLKKEVQDRRPHESFLKKIKSFPVVRIIDTWMTLVWHPSRINSDRFLQPVLTLHPEMLSVHLEKNCLSHWALLQLSLAFCRQITFLRMEEADKSTGANIDVMVLRSATWFSKRLFLFPINMVLWESEPMKLLL